MSEVKQIEAKTVIIPRGFGSSHERGLRWFVIWNTKTKRRSAKLLCACGKLTAVKKAEFDFSHRCGFQRRVSLEGFVKL